MKKLALPGTIIVFVLGALLTLAISATTDSADDQKRIFGDMIKWLNENPAPTDDRAYFRGYEMIMTNNTIRTDGAGNVYQYASYAMVYANSPMSISNRELGVSPIRGSLEYKNVEQSFSGDDHFKTGNKRDRIDLKIYYMGGVVYVETKLLSWGNVVARRKAVISKTAHGGYLVQFSDANANFFTILLRQVRWDAPG